MYFPEDHDVIDRIARDVNNNCKDKGFQEELKLAERLEARADVGAEAPLTDGGLSVDDVQLLRDSAEALRVNFIGMKLALMHSEISEALERLREVGIGAVLAGDEPFIEELADVNIRVMETAAIIGKRSFGETLLAKIKVNAGRPFKHGKEH